MTAAFAVNKGYLIISKIRVFTCCDGIPDGGQGVLVVAGSDGH